MKQIYLKETQVFGKDFWKENLNMNKFVLKFSPQFTFLVSQRAKTLALIESFKNAGYNPRKIQNMAGFCNKCLCFHQKMRKWDHRRIGKKTKRLNKILKEINT